MTRSTFRTLTFTALFGLALTCRATDYIIVNDTWADGDRTSSGPDGSGIDSPWYASSASTLTVPAAGDMQGTVGTGSSFWTTYFPSAVTLANPGDTLKVTWNFTATGINANNTSQGFNVALAKTPGTQLSADGASPASEAYSGYAMFMNMGQTLGNSSPFALKEWIASGSGNLLGTSGNWGANGASGTLANGATSGNTGYSDGTSYSLVMMLTLNASGNLDIASIMTGGSLNGTGSASVAYTDTTPNSLSYDTFAIRPTSAATTASQFDTSLFKVELITTVPEPSTVALAGVGGVLCLVARFRCIKR